MNKDQQWIKALQKGERSVLGEIYLHYQTGFTRFARRYSIGTEEVQDIYQDSIIALYENIRQGKLGDLKSSLKTYLFAVGKYKILDRLKHTAQIPPVGPSEPRVEDSAPLEPSEDEERQHLLQKALGQLGPRCRDILTRFYYEGQKLEDIQGDLGYPSKDTVKAQKSRCLKQLKEIVNSHGKR